MKRLEINVDNSLINSDWIKTASWDLPLEPKAFLIAIGGNWEKFQHLPAFQKMPESLKTAVNNYLQNDVAKHLAGQHDQSTHGNWAGHSGAKSDYAYPVADAIDAVVAGKKGQISPLDVHFFMEQMAKRQDNPDLTNLEIVGTHFYTGDNMGIPRDKMPQVPSGLKDEFLAEMDKQGISYKRVDVSPQALHPIQSEISASKSAQIMLSLQEKGIGDDDKSRIIVSSDNYVIDGHHRWAAILTMSLRDSSVKMPVIKVNVPAKELIDVVHAWDDVVGVKPIALGERNKNSAFAKALRFDIAILNAKIKSTEVEKHLQGQHDQSTHGRRFNTSVAPEVVHDVLAQVAENGGLSIKLTDGSLPPDGYMVSRNSDKFGTVVMASDFFDEKKGAKILGAFLIKNKAELGSGRAYLGVWHETSKTVNGVTVEIPKDQQRVHLDVTDKIVSKKQAISLGRRRNQISIWDVVNFDEIQTGGTGGTVEKRNHKHSLVPEAIKRDDGRGNYGLGGKDLRQVAETSVTLVVPVSSDLTKHLAGQHDQSSHGIWAAGKRSDKEKSVQARISNVKIEKITPEEPLLAGSTITAEYKTPAGQTIYLTHENSKIQNSRFKTLQEIEMETIAEVDVEGGRAQIASMYSGGYAHREATITGISVAPEYQRQGIATAMLNLARRYSQDGVKIEHSFSLTEDSIAWSEVVKHLQGQHDQSTHGSWAGAKSYKSASLDDLPSMQISDSLIMDARDNYVTSGYRWMNDYLRNGYIEDYVPVTLFDKIPKEQAIAQINVLKNALYQTETTEDLTVTRWSSGASLFRQQVSTMSEKDIQKLVGKTFEAKGFTSTSAPNSLHQSVNDSYKASSTVFANIHMPAGTHGATMGNDKESEFVIAPNTTFVVMGAKRLDKNRIVLDLLVTGQENG